MPCFHLLFVFIITNITNGNDHFIFYFVFSKIWYRNGRFSKKRSNSYII